ncbi:hypothetical protein D083_3053 [Dickeya solani RNS 08.23.3.1.A]|nr:hypothetical protein D083_3053 [Dickeya solani RNS 08.23.3.1.A]
MADLFAIFISQSVNGLSRVSRVKNHRLLRPGKKGNGLWAGDFIQNK